MPAARAAFLIFLARSAVVLKLTILFRSGGRTGGLIFFMLGSIKGLSRGPLWIPLREMISALSET